MSQVTNKIALILKFGIRHMQWKQRNHTESLIWILIPYYHSYLIPLHPSFSRSVLSLNFLTIPKLITPLFLASSKQKETYIQGNLRSKQDLLMIRRIRRNFINNCGNNVPLQLLIQQKKKKKKKRKEEEKELASLKPPINQSMKVDSNNMYLGGFTLKTNIIYLSCFTTKIVRKM